MEPLTFSYTLEPKDYAQALRETSIRQLNILISMIAITFIGLFLLISSIIQIVNSSRTNGSQSLFLSVLVGIAVLSIPIYSYFLWPRLLHRKRIKNQTYIAEISWLMTDHSVHIESNLTTKEMEWSAFRRIRKLRAYYLIDSTLNKRAFHIIPRRVFETPEQEALFQRFVEDHIGPVQTSFQLR